MYRCQTPWKWHQVAIQFQDFNSKSYPGAEISQRLVADWMYSEESGQAASLPCPHPFLLWPKMLSDLHRCSSRYWHTNRMLRSKRKGLITQGVVPLFQLIFPKLQENSKSLQYSNLKMDFWNFCLKQALGTYLSELIIFVNNTEVIFEGWCRCSGEIWAVKQYSVRERVRAAHFLVQCRVCKVVTVSAYPRWFSCSAKQLIIF